MNQLYDVFESIVQSAEAKSVRSEGDYIEDGLLYCCKCNKKKQMRYKVLGTERILPCLCSCGKDERDGKEKSEKAAEDMRHIMELRRSSLMDDKFLNCTFDNTDVNEGNKRPYRVARKYAEMFETMESKNQGLLFWGDKGTGKTHMACAIANYLLDRGVPVMATSIVKVLSSMQNKEDRFTIDRFIYLMKDARLLILDDIGAERNTDYALEMEYNIIDSRYRSGKPMIITSNVSLREMQTTQDIRYGRIYDRILEGCYPVMFEGVSWRMKNAARRFDEMDKYFT